MLAKDLLLVRERELRFYARNLSMVGTHAALLAGFAFTILSQYTFKSPSQGYLPFSVELDLRMWDRNQTEFLQFPGLTLEQITDLRPGMAGWSWTTWLQQVFQILHLLFTSLGMTLTLWTLYTCVITNILGVHLALRGPEGSVDRAVRHMAQQNQFALRKFVWGLVLFILSVIFFSLSEYHFFVSSVICIAVCLMTWRIYNHIKKLAVIFHLPSDDTITGQWDIDNETPAKRPAGRYSLRRSPSISSVKMRDAKEDLGVLAMGDMLAGKYTSFRRPHGPHKNAARLRFDAIRERWKAGKRRGGSAWASLHGWAARGAMIQDEVACTKQVQAPSCVAEQLIFKQQGHPVNDNTSPVAERTLRRGLSRACGRRRLTRGSSCRGSSAGSEASVASWRQPAAMRTEGFSSPEAHFLSPSVVSSTGGTPDSLANSGGDWDNGREKNGHSLFPNNVLGLTPFFDELINNFGTNTRAQRACERLQTAARGSITRQRSRDSTACVEEENIQSLAEDSRFSMSSQYSQEDDDVDYSPSPRCIRLDKRSSNSDARAAKHARGLRSDGAVQEGNFLDQASDLFESVRHIVAQSTVLRRARPASDDPPPLQLSLAEAFSLAAPGRIWQVLDRIGLGSSTQAPSRVTPFSSASVISSQPGGNAQREPISLEAQRAAALWTSARVDRYEGRSPGPRSLLVPRVRMASDQSAGAMTGRNVQGQGRVSFEEQPAAPSSARRS